MTAPSASGSELHRLPADEALALVDRLLGPATDWPSPLIAYRLTAEFQEDWKVELGQWLRAAEEYGFLDRVLHELEHQAKRPSPTTEIEANDRHHLKLQQHVAAARVVHYLTATGWSFDGYETETGGAIDIDCALLAPDSQLVEFQVKAPDQPGRVLGHRLVDGGYDNRVVEAVKKAGGQLRRPPTGAAMVAVCANRSWSLAWEPGCLVSYLVGSTVQVDDAVFLERAREGHYFADEWKHVSGILILDLLRGELTTQYTCTVLTNPKATFRVEPDWFPRSRVCVLDGDRFRWVRGSPGRAHGLPDGTQLVDMLPDF